MNAPYQQLVPGAGFPPQFSELEATIKGKQSSIRCTRLFGCCLGVLALGGVIAVTILGGFWKSSAVINLEIDGISIDDVTVDTYVTGAATYFGGYYGDIGISQLHVAAVSVDGSFKDISGSLSNGLIYGGDALNEWASTGFTAFVCAIAAIVCMALACLLFPCASSLATMCGCRRAKEAKFHAYIPSLFLLFATGALATAVVFLNSGSLQDMDKPTSILATCSAIVYASFAAIVNQGLAPSGQSSLESTMASVCTFIVDIESSHIAVTVSSPAMLYFLGCIAGALISLILCLLADCNASSLRQEMHTDDERNKMFAAYGYPGSLNSSIQMNVQHGGMPGQPAYQPPSLVTPGMFAMPNHMQPAMPSQMQVSTTLEVASAQVEP